MTSHFILFIWGFISLIFIFKDPFNFSAIYVYFCLTGEAVTGREQPQGQKVTQGGPKCHASWSKTSCKGQNFTLKCHNYGLIETPAIKSIIKVWDEITYPLLNLNGVTVEVWE